MCPYKYYIFFNNVVKQYPVYKCTGHGKVLWTGRYEKKLLKVEGNENYQKKLENRIFNIIMYIV